MLIKWLEQTLNSLDCFVTQIDGIGLALDNDKCMMSRIIRCLRCPRLGVAFLQMLKTEI